MRVRCTSTTTPDGRIPALTVGDTYEVLGIEAGDLRLIDDFGSPVLFERALFEVVDDARPADWVTAFEDGVEYAGPPEFDSPGFWEDFHEQLPEARAAFARYLNRHLRTTDAA